MSGLNNMLCNVKYGTRDDVDSSADEPTEESADKSDPGVIVLDD